MHQLLVSYAEGSPGGYQALNEMSVYDFYNFLNAAKARNLARLNALKK